MNRFSALVVAVSLSTPMVVLPFVMPDAALAVDTGSGSNSDYAPAPQPAPQPNQSQSPTTSPTTEPTAEQTMTQRLASIRTLIGTKKYSTALASLRVAEKAAPKDADIKNLLGFTSRKLKKYTEAASYYKSALKINPKHLGALEYQGELFITQKKIPLAKQNLAKLKNICGTTCPEYLDLKKAIGSR